MQIISSALKPLPVYGVGKEGKSVPHGTEEDRLEKLAQDLSQAERKSGQPESKASKEHQMWEGRINCDQLKSFSSVGIHHHMVTHRLEAQ